MSLVDTLLLTGAAGDIAASIARIVRHEGLARRIVGADARPGWRGGDLYDATAALPMADDPLYPDRLDALVRREAAGLVAPLPDAELATLFALGRIGAPGLLSANARALDHGLDKWRTWRLLAAAGVPTPRTGLIGESEPDVFPAIVKPRRGQGGKGVVLIDGPQWPIVAAERRGDLWQAWLPDAHAEYTCGLFRTETVPLRTIVMRRTLAGGLTASAEVVSDPSIDRVLTRLAQAVDLHGSINVQLRMMDGVPFVFEINARFSSTVGFRHRLGFSDLLWSMQHALGHPIGDYAGPAVGARLRRAPDGTIVSEPRAGS